MKHLLRNFFCFIIFLSINSTVLADWQSIAWSQFEKNEFDQAIKTAKNSGSSSLFARLIQLCSYSEKVALYKAKTDKAAKNSLLKILENSVSINDVRTLSKFAAEKDKPETIEVINKLIKSAFSNINKSNDIRLLIDFLDDTSFDEKTNDLALKSLMKFLKNQRRYVMKGGSIPQKERNIMMDDDLLNKLIALANLNTKAVRCLVLIEKPALEHVEKSTGKGIEKAFSRIQKAIAKRLKKYPESEWWSAHP